MDVDRLREILDLVEESLEEPTLPSGELAERAYLSRYYFNRLVSDALGEPPGTFRRRLLLERSAYQLSSSRTSVIQIAFRAGYGGPDSFSRAFAHAFGMPPTRYRSAGVTDHRLATPNNIHFTPPDGLRLPPTTKRGAGTAPERSTRMDTTLDMLDHHLWLSDQILDRASRLDGDVLDRPITMSVEGIDAHPTLRSLSARLVTQLEMWLAAFGGATETPPAGDTTPSLLRKRLSIAGSSFRDVMASALAEGRGRETFIDATCRPAHVFTYAGVLAHVLTFSAVRRTMAIGALETAGIADLGCGDPMEHVGGSGDDASRIRRE